MNDRELLRRQQNIERIKNFRLIDDSFMVNVFNDIKSVELLLKIILDTDDLEIVSVSVEEKHTNYSGREVRLDVKARDSVRGLFNVEVQRGDHGAHPKRARYHSSIIDTHELQKQEDFTKLPSVYVIFITENDVLRGEKPIYHIDRTIREMGGRPFGDESHIIYVNNKIQDNTPLGRLMHDFVCTDADNMYYRTLADRMRYFKESEKGVDTMCKIMEEIRQEGIKEGMKEGREEGMKEGMKEGRAEGLREGLNEGIDNMLRHLRTAGIDEATLNLAAAQARKQVMTK